MYMPWSAGAKVPAIVSYGTSNPAAMSFNVARSYADTGASAAILSALLGFSSQLRMRVRRLMSAGLTQVVGRWLAEDVGAELVSRDFAARRAFDG